MATVFPSFFFSRQIPNSIHSLQCQCGRMTATLKNRTESIPLCNCIALFPGTAYKAAQLPRDNRREGLLATPDSELAALLLHVTASHHTGSFVWNPELPLFWWLIPKVWQCFGVWTRSIGCLHDVRKLPFDFRQVCRFCSLAYLGPKSGVLAFCDLCDLGDYSLRSCSESDCMNLKFSYYLFEPRQGEIG